MSPHRYCSNVLIFPWTVESLILVATSLSAIALVRIRRTQRKSWQVHVAEGMEIFSCFTNLASLFLTVVLFCNDHGHHRTQQDMPTKPPTDSPEVPVLLADQDQCGRQGYPEHAIPSSSSVEPTHPPIIRIHPPTSSTEVLASVYPPADTISSLSCRKHQNLW